jgi:hypothetical protein
MQALVYVSTATMLPTQDIVEPILATAHRNNATFGLTGMLLWKEMAFAQLLEGPPESLDSLWDRLVADDRHEDVRLLSRWEIEERFFSEWSMASHRLDQRQHWELLDRSENESDEDFCAWILYLMNDIHRSATLL